MLESIFILIIAGILDKKLVEILTFNNHNTFRSIRSEVICGYAFVLARITWLGVDDFYSDDSICVSDRILGSIKFFASLQPFDLKKSRNLLSWPIILNLLIRFT